jgi:hypothetical protein
MLTFPYHHLFLLFLFQGEKSLGEDVDWTSLPTSLLISIFQTVVQHQCFQNLDVLVPVKDIIKAYDAISRTCKAWRRTLHLVPLSLTLDTDVQAAFQRSVSWLSHNSIRALIMRRNVAEFVRLRPRAIQNSAFDLALLMDADFISNSKETLQTLMNVSFRSTRLLLPFQNLSKLSLCNPYVSRQSMVEMIDAAPLHHLTKLTCLSMSGLIRRPMPWKSLPPTLRHLALNADDLYASKPTKVWSYRDGFHVYLPKTLSRLEYLSVHASMPVVDWESLTDHTCLELSVSGAGVSFLLPPPLKSKSKPKPISETGADTEAETEEQLTKRFCDMLVAASTLSRLNIKFSKLELLAASWDKNIWARSFRGLSGIGQFESSLRQHALCLWDINVEETFVNTPTSSLTSNHIYKIKADRQVPGKPRGYHFKWPLSPRELHLVKTFPARRIVWYHEDGDGSAELLRDPEFMASNGPTLKRMVGVSVPAGTDLRPFKVLESLHPMLLQTSSFPLTGIRLPASLVWLDLSAPSVGNILWTPEGALAGLTSLRGLVLDRWSKADLSHLNSKCLETIRITNPMGDLSPVIGPETIKLPRHFDDVDAQRRDATGSRSWAGLRTASPLIAAQLMVRCSQFDLDEDETPESSLGEQSVVYFRDSWKSVMDSATNLPETSEVVFNNDDNHSDSDNGRNHESNNVVDDQQGWRAPCTVHLNDRPDIEQRYNMSGHQDDLYELYFVKGIEPYNIGKHGAPFLAGGCSRVEIHASCGWSQFVVDMAWLVKARVDCIIIHVRPEMDTCLGEFPIVHADCGCSWSEFKQILKNSTFRTLRFHAAVDNLLFVFREYHHFCGKLPAYCAYEFLMMIESDLSNLFVIESGLPGEVDLRPGLHEDGDCFEITRKRVVKGKNDSS